MGMAILDPIDIRGSGRHAGLLDLAGNLHPSLVATKGSGDGGGGSS